MFKIIYYARKNGRIQKMCEHTSNLKASFQLLDMSYNHYKIVEIVHLTR